MRKLFGIVTIIVLSFSILAGCGRDVTNEEAENTLSPLGAENTTPPAAAPDADLPSAGTDTETNTSEVTSAIDITAYPVMWYQENPIYPEIYDSRFKTTSASEIYEKDDVLGTEFVGYRLIDDTHIEIFGHFKLNDDIDASLMLSSLDEEFFNEKNMIRISDWEANQTGRTYTYEINGTNISIFAETSSLPLPNYSVSPDFTSFFQGQTEYTYHADF